MLDFLFDSFYCYMIIKLDLNALSFSAIFQVLFLKFLLVLKYKEKVTCLVPGSWMSSFF
jgi:hypothetical protein